MSAITSSQGRPFALPAAARRSAVCVSRWRTVMLSLPCCANSGMCLATRSSSPSLPRSTSRITATAVTGLPALSHSIRSSVRSGWPGRDSPTARSATTCPSSMTNSCAPRCNPSSMPRVITLCVRGSAVSVAIIRVSVPRRLCPSSADLDWPRVPRGLLLMTADTLPNFDELWDYNDPATTEQKFRALLPRAEASADRFYHAQLLTQLARAQGLQRKFDEAHATLDQVAQVDQPPARVRYLLERGRVFN